VLVIDDNPEIHDDFRKLLCQDREMASDLDAAEAALFGNPGTLGGQSYFLVDSAHQGREGLAKVYHALQEGRPYALAFLDIRMPPGWDGLEVAPRLWIADPDLQIVLCTAYSDYSWEQMFAKLGASERIYVLRKPFERDEVLQLAHSLTRRREARQKERAKIEHLEQTLAERTQVLEQTSARLEAEIQQLKRGGKTGG
jgi:CheY-like chemotaxis protein